MVHKSIIYESQLKCESKLSQPRQSRYRRGFWTETQKATLFVYQSVKKDTIQEADKEPLERWYKNLKGNIKNQTLCLGY